MVIVVLLAGGCGEDEDDPTTGSDRASGEDPASATTAESGDDSGCRLVGDSSDAATATFQLTLSEYAIAPMPADTPAGTVELVASNGGTIPHELAVYRFDGDPATLPTSFVGGVDESQLPDEGVVGRIRWIEAGQSCTLPLDLDAGSYLLICNLVDDGSNPHYAHGMYTAFTVT